MNLGASALLGRKHSIADAERTIKLALSALGRGDYRLAASRSVTAVIQAASASVGAEEEVIERAEQVVHEARRVIQGLVIAQAVSCLSFLGGRNQA